MMAVPLLDLSLLRTFVLLAEEGSVTRVAQRLNRTQPAVSLQLNRLEQLVGRKIFETSLRRPKLTPHGETLLDYARKLLDLDHEARARLRSDEVSGRVVLGCPDLYAAFLLPRTLARFQASYPNIEVTVYCALSRKVAEVMENGDIDVAVVTHMPDVNPHLTNVTLLRREKLVWLGAEGGSAQQRDPPPRRHVAGGQSVPAARPECLGCAEAPMADCLRVRKHRRPAGNGTFGRGCDRARAKRRGARPAAVQFRRRITGAS